MNYSVNFPCTLPKGDTTITWLHVYCVANFFASVDLLYVAPLPVALLPTIVTATVTSCGTVTLQWDPASQPSDITCTPPSPGCASCTTSPCTITGLNSSAEYEFTVTVNSGHCRANMNTTTARPMGEIDCVKCACLVSAYSVSV